MKNRLIADNRCSILWAGLFSIVVLTACSNSTPPEPLSSQFASGITTSLDNVTKRIENTWAPPTLINNQVVEGPFNFAIDLATTNSGALFVSWQGHSLTNNSDITHKTLATTFWRPPNRSVWQMANPFEYAAAQVSTFPHMITHQKTNDTYAITATAGRLLMNRFDLAQSSWNTPVIVGNDINIQQTNYATTLDVAGNLTFIRYVNQANGSIDLVIRSYLVASGLTNDIIFTRTQPNAVNGTQFTHITGLSNENSDISIVWSETFQKVNPNDSTNTFPVTEIWGINYLPDLGWTIPQQIASSLVQPELSQIISIQLAPLQNTNDLHLIYTVIDTNANSKVYSSQFINGSWHLPQQIDANTNRVKLTKTMMATSINHRGESIILWSEQQQDTSQRYTVLLAKRFTPATGWQAVETISPQYIPNSTSGEPSIPVQNITVHDDGSATATWQLLTKMTYEIFVSQYQPNREWSSPELVFSGDPRNSISLTHALPAIDRTGLIALVFGENKTTSTGNVFNIYMTKRTGEGATNPPPLVGPVTPPADGSGTTPSTRWSPPIDVLSTVGQPGYDNFLEGPTLVSDNAGNAYFFLRKLRLLNAIENTYLNGRNIILQALDVGVWGPTYPVPKEMDLQASSVVLKIAKQTGDLFAAWMVNSQLYVNHMNPSNNWGTPQPIATDVASFHLLVNPMGSMVIAWTPRNPVTNHLLLKRMNTIDTTTIGFHAQESLTLPNNIHMAEPIIDASANVTIAWLADVLKADASIDYRKIILRINRPATSWDITGAEQRLPTPYQQYDALLIAPGLSQAVITLAYQTSLEGLFIANHYIQANGWGDFETFLNPSDYITIQPPQLISNRSGDVLVYWIAAEYFESTEHTHHILSNHYSAAPDSTGKHWTTPSIVGSTLHPNSFYSPIIAMTTQGTAEASWIENGLSGSTLYTNTFHVDTGWETKPDIVFSTLSDNIFLREADLTINTQSEAILVWKTLVGGQLGGEYHFYVSKQNIIF